MPRRNSRALAIDGEFEDRSESRAREDELRDTDRRVMRCVQLMSTGRWERGVTGPELAKEWGVTESLMENVAAEASRHLRLVKAPEAFLQTVLAELQTVLEGHSDPFVKIAAAKTIIDGLKAAGAKAGGPTAPAPYVVGPTELRDTLVAELLAPGPELAEALELTGYRRTIDTTGVTTE